MLWKGEMHSLCSYINRTILYMKLKGDNSMIEIHVKVKYDLDKISSDILHFSAANILTNYGYI